MVRKQGEIYSQLVSTTALGETQINHYDSVLPLPCLSFCHPPLSFPFLLPMPEPGKLALATDLHVTITSFYQK